MCVDSCSARGPASKPLYEKASGERDVHREEVGHTVRNRISMD